MEKSANYNFNLPNSANDEIADINDISDNFRIIDEIMNETDQTFEPTSTKAASGKAVNEAISGIQPIDENTEFVFDGGDVDGGVSVDIVVDTVLSKTSNNPIANKAVATKFSEIIRAIDTLENMVHIVESGTSGTWNYRKWSDGTAECWGRYTASGINAAKNNYSGYYYSDIIEILLPCDFLSIEDYRVNGGSEDRVNFARGYGDYSSGKKVGFRICGHESEATSVDISVYVSVKGRWK